jgi:hypothetical protein
MAYYIPPFDAGYLGVDEPMTSRERFEIEGLLTPVDSIMNSGLRGRSYSSQQQLSTLVTHPGRSVTSPDGWPGGIRPNSRAGEFVTVTRWTRCRYW